MYKGFGNLGKVLDKIREDSERRIREQKKECVEKHVVLGSQPCMRDVNLYCKCGKCKIMGAQSIYDFCCKETQEAETCFARNIDAFRATENCICQKKEFIELCLKPHEMEKVQKQMAGNGRNRRAWAETKRTAARVMAACTDRLLNHYWWSISKANGNGALAVELIMSAVLHCRGIHTGFLGTQELAKDIQFEFTLIDSCAHDHDGTEIMDDGSVEHGANELYSATEKENYEEADVEVCADSGGIVEELLFDSPVERDEDQDARERPIFDIDYEPHEIVIRSFHNAVIKQRTTIQMCAPSFTTSSIELANALATSVYLNKACWFAPPMYDMRTKLVVMDWNEKVLTNLENDTLRRQMESNGETDMDAEAPPAPKKVRVYSKPRKRFVMRTRRAPPKYKFRKDVLNNVLEGATTRRTGDCRTNAEGIVLP